MALKSFKNMNKTVDLGDLDFSEDLGDFNNPEVDSDRYAVGQNVATTWTQDKESPTKVSQAMMHAALLDCKFNFLIN